MIHTLYLRYRLLRIAEAIILSTALCLILLKVTNSLHFSSAIAIGCTFILFAWRIFTVTPSLFRQRELLAYLNYQHPQVEFSTDLLTMPGEKLLPLQRLQKTIVERRLIQIRGQVRLPHLLYYAIGLLVLGIGIYALPVSTHSVSYETEVDPPSAAPPSQEEGIEMELITRIQPPAYTRIPSSSQVNGNVTIPWGSSIEWVLTFTGNVRQVYLIQATGDSVMMDQKDDHWSVKRKVTQSGFYYFSWFTTQGLRKSSELFQMKVINDASPQVEVLQTNSYEEIRITDNPIRTLHLRAADDYGIVDGYIVATVARGSGEAVKFREEKITFPVARKPSFQSQLTLDLRQLKMEPGDELYFFAEVVDNHPLHQTGRTETFFISIADTAALESSMDTGIGVDLMPEYFRSQRQIIMDTEKLIRNKRNLSREAFNNTSNELAHDQKLLRLRYGQFLGEEFESALVQTETKEHHHKEEKVEETYGHSHDTDADHHHLDEEAEEPDKKKEVEIEFGHSHDDEEQAAFFTIKIRTKLKQALSLMWEAELPLRLNTPAQSLPYQYKILRLLKEISQDSRIYVHRTGFDAPPLKEEKRLSGDVTDLKSRSVHTVPVIQVSLPNIREGFRLVSALLARGSTSISKAQQNVLHEAGKELSTLALEQPGNHLNALSVMQRISANANSQVSRKDLLLLRHAFNQALPTDKSLLSASPPRSPAMLEDQFIKLLERDKF